MPNIPDIDPKITLDRCKTIELLLSSIALEEISLSHILNAEGEKLQLFLKTNPTCLEDFIKINNSVNKTLRTVVKSQILLQFKLEDVISLDTEECRKKKPEECDCQKKDPCQCQPKKEHKPSPFDKFSCDNP